MNKSIIVTNNLLYGGDFCKNDISSLMLLSDYIEQLLKYNLSTNAINCLTKSEFTNIYNNATSFCKICDCD